MEVITRKTLWEGSFIRSVLITYRGSDGKQRTWEAIERINADGIVVIVPITTNNELILIRQFRPALDRYVIELPAGLVEPGEDIFDSCRRELIEETGYTADSFSLLAEGVMSTGITSDIWKVVLARNASEAPEELKRRYPPDENEDIAAFRVPLEHLNEKLGEMSRNGDYPDLRIYGMVELFRNDTRSP